MMLIVGLGNPEEKYANTRHNLGFETLDDFRRTMNAPVWTLEDKFRAEISQTDFSTDQGNVRLILARPQTYMNNSGMAVSKLSQYFKISPENIVLVYDDLDLNLGQIKIRLGGAAAGHHGVESVIDKLGTDNFIRVRLGIGNLRSFSSERGGQHFSAESYVLEPFLPNEHSDVKKMIKQAIKALDILLTKGLDKAQNQFN